MGLIVVISAPVFLIHRPLSVTRDRPPVDEHLPRLPQLLLLAQTARPVHISSHSLYMILQGWAGTRIHSTRYCICLFSYPILPPIAHKLSSPMFILTCFANPPHIYYPIYIYTNVSDGHFVPHPCFTFHSLRLLYFRSGC